jgi:hypothetical protein
MIHRRSPSKYLHGLDELPPLLQAASIRQRSRNGGQHLGGLAAWRPKRINPDFSGCKPTLSDGFGSFDEPYTQRRRGGHEDLPPVIVDNHMDQ